jgi:hypothetical protein
LVFFASSSLYNAASHARNQGALPATSATQIDEVAMKQTKQQSGFIFKRRGSPFFYARWWANGEEHVETTKKHTLFQGLL